MAAPGVGGRVPGFAGVGVDEDGLRSLEAELEQSSVRLEHLLAARLSERNGVNLYQDPATARRLFCKHRGDTALWRWIAPDGANEQPQANRRDIPRHVLLRLIERLEKL